MHNHEEKDPANLEEMKYETRDLSIRSIVVFIIVLFVLGTAAFLVTIWPIQPGLESISKQENPSASALATKEGLPAPQPPSEVARLQGAPARVQIAGSLKDMRIQREEYNLPQKVDAVVPKWVSKDQNIVTIPVDDAIRIVAQRGIAPKTMPPTAPATPPVAAH